MFHHNHYSGETFDYKPEIISNPHLVQIGLQCQPSDEPHKRINLRKKKQTQLNEIIKPKWLSTCELD